MSSSIDITSTKADYIQRVNMIMDFIERNPNETLSLKNLADKACFSAFHFHRIFLEIAGETIKAFITRKRIEKIASLLMVGTRERVTDLALTYGFSSGNAFARAFKKFYGISPMAFKARFSKIGVTILNYDVFICMVDNKEASCI